MTDLELTAEVLKENGADGIVVFDEPSIRFFAGIDVSDNAAVITEKGVYLIADMRYFEDVKGLKGITAVKNEGGLFATLGALVSELSLKTVLFDESKLSLSKYEALSDIISAKKGAKAISRILARKSGEALDFIREAQKITDAAFLHVLPLLKEGVSELEIVSEIIYFMKKRGAGEAFDTMVLFGEKTSVPHGVPSSNKLKNGMPVLFDFGAKLNGFCSDMSRSFYFGGTVPEDYGRAFNTVLSAQEAALFGIKAGKSGKECDALARDIIDASEFSGLFTHSLGHGVGAEIHEWPCFAPRCDYPIPARSVLSVEPGVYLEGKFGIRIEDLVFVTENGAENLTSSPKFIKL